MFYGFLFRRGSFHQLEADLEDRFLQQWIGVSEPFREGTFRYSCSSFDLVALEAMLVGINQQLKRNKVSSQGQVAGRIVAALDGIEILSSYSRCCDFCLHRIVREKTKEGDLVERIQYYHRAVGCQIVSSPVKPFLGVEWLRAGEDEVAAAKWLLERIRDQYGSRFFDVLLLEFALCAGSRVETGKGDRLGSCNRSQTGGSGSLLRRLRACSTIARLICCESEPGRSVQVQMWDQDGLPFTRDHPQPVRVLRSDERVMESHIYGGRLEPVTTDHRWIWISTLDSKTVNAKTLRQMGHMRWKIENNGWNDLTQNWAMKHGFLHACKHRVKKPGSDQPVENRGLAAVVLTPCISFALFTAFTLLHSKFYRIRKTTYQEVTQALHRSMLRSQPPIRAPDG